jgi:hypothetical protein
VSAATLDQARAAREKARATLADRPEVTGIGITRHQGGYAVKVNLTTPSDAVPEEILGVPVRTEVVGPVRKRAKS